MIEDVKIAIAWDVMDIEQQIMTLVNDGYIPQGGVSHSTKGLLQLMVKHTPIAIKNQILTEDN